MVKQTKPRPQSGLSLAQSRRELARIDRQLVRLINQRAKLVVRIHHAETADAAEGATSWDEARWNERRAHLRRLTTDSKGPLSAEQIQDVLQLIDSASAALVQHHRVALLGPEFGASHLVARQHWGKSVEFVQLPTLAAVFDEVNRRHVSFGIVPLENYGDGRMADTLTLLSRVPVTICGELLWRPRYCLLAKGLRAEVHEVYAKAQALADCHRWLVQNLPHARLVEVASTSAAAKIAVDKPGAAVVANRAVAQHFVLDVLAEAIADDPGNLVRFVILGDRPPRRTGNDKTAIIMVLPHSVSSLADAMAVFKRDKVNITSLESYPSPGEDQDYLFFIEFSGHQQEARTGQLLAALKRRASRLLVLGSYPKATCVH